jgi:anti-sigma factor RsiW
MSTDSPSSMPSHCARAEALRDYAFDELPADERRAMEQHLAACGDCALELDQLRLTSAALRTLPDREIPQRIAFVSDRVFEPSAFRRFWNSGARLGFASACVLAVALVVSAWHLSGHYAESRTVVQTASVAPDRINAAVARAVAQVRADDALVIEAAVQAAERKRDAEYRGQMVALEENFDVLRKTMNRDYARLEGNEPGAGQ